LFVQAKANLRRLVSFREQQKHLMSIIGQWEAEETRYAGNPTSDLYILARTSKLDVQEQLTKNLTTQHQINVSLNVQRKDIEQICFEIEQIYNGVFDRVYESVREYYNLLDSLRFDSTVHDVEHDFINELYLFTCLRFGNVE
jgi:hypothetical protein